MNDSEIPQEWVNMAKFPRMILRRDAGISFRDQDEMDLRCHIVAEDLRYPTFCVNGDLNFGLSFDPDTLEVKRERQCICAARYEDECICDI